MYRAFLVPASCPHEDCGKSLLSEEHPIGGKPSVHLIVEKKGERGDIYLSAWYDDFRTILPDKPNILPGDIVKLYCPYCGKELPFAERCACKAPMVYLAIESNGRVRICTRSGCHYHSLEFSNSAELQALLAKAKK
ncbi:hypothetical protein DRQ36_01740 [bacterium]|nr:MAG: hypothetical protein DRQ36_01740 [bacterium]